jgi:hypothetical protein
MEEVNNMLQYAQIAQNSGPEGQMSIRVGEMLDLIAEKLGVPQKIRPTPDERRMMMQEAAQAAQQMAQQNPEAAMGVAGDMLK